MSQPFKLALAVMACLFIGALIYHVLAELHRLGALMWLGM